ncbi:MAG: hypothetical protein A2283_03755 [Lentisphaerae bacterium RIFOXYA12_FULL_48_11]|nr:MAG: hypothetical protein A2283_03755 [Lentisphaerae bacterium RIFOXYA12_FULL_48_11]
MRKSKNISGKNIAQARNRRKWTQKEMAKRLKKCGMRIDRAGLAKIENGLRCVYDYELVGIARVLKVDVRGMVK